MSTTTRLLAALAASAILLTGCGTAESPSMVEPAGAPAPAQPAGGVADGPVRGESKPADMAIEHLSTSDLVVVKNDEMAQAIGVDLSALDA